MVEDEIKDVIYGIDVCSEIKINFYNEVLFKDAKTGELYYIVYEILEDGSANEIEKPIGNSKKLN